MRRALATTLLLGLLGLLSLLAVPVGAHALAIGVADQKTDLFGDQRFTSLGLHEARLSIPWDVFESRSETAHMNLWLKAARAGRVRPLVTFDHAALGRHHRQLPSAAHFRSVFEHFHRRYPWVRNFASWNEANLCDEPTCHSPDKVAAYYLAMRAVCHSCRVLGAELLDLPNMVTWVKQFRHFARVDPHYWGLHNYIGANRLSLASTRALLHATKGEIWFTETAGLVSRRNHSRLRLPEGPAHAALVTRFIFDRMVRLSRRITHVYLYQWNSPGPLATWDSAMIGPDGQARPALAVLQAELRSHRQPAG